MTSMDGAEVESKSVWVKALLGGQFEHGKARAKERKVRMRGK